MEQISITQEEKDVIRKSSCLKDIVFCYHKYYSEDKECLKSIFDWTTFRKKLKNDYITGYLLDCEPRIDKRYASVYDRFKKIQKAFGIKRGIKFNNQNESIFWYTLLIRTEQNPNPWHVICSLHKAPSVEFVHVYQRMSSLKSKQSFVKEIDSFIRKYSDLIGIIDRDVTQDQEFRSLQDRTNIDILNILLSFDQFEIQDALKELHLFSAEHMCNEPRALEIAKRYYKYVDSIKERVSNVIRETNQEFALDPSLFPKTYDTIENMANIQSQIFQIHTDRSHINRQIATAIREINSYVLYSATHTDDFDDLESMIPDIFADRLEEDPYTIGAVLHFIIRGLKLLDPNYYSELSAENIRLFMTSLPEESKLKVRFDFSKLLSSYTNLASYLVLRPHLMREWGIGFL